MNDAVKRALRTFLQAFIGTFAVLAIPALNSVITSAGDASGFVRIDLNLLGNAAIAGVLAGFIALVTFVQNWLEESGAVKPVLKTNLADVKADAYKQGLDDASGPVQPL